MKLNLGCGNDYKQGYVNCDVSDELRVDKIVNLEEKLPFDDNSVEYILVKHCLEHIKNIFPLFEEFQRICKPHAIIRIEVPYFSSESAFSTMTHIRFFTWTSFDFLNKDNPLSYDAPDVNFKIIFKRLIWRKPFKLFELLFNLTPRLYQEIFCWIFPARQLYVELEVEK